MSKGNINVSVENIFPLIKKFLYSDHEIFLRELISNATDATTKLKHLISIGEAQTELGDAKIEIKIDGDAKTLTIKDNGLGMTAEEVEKYINQIAFSGAEEFLEKYKDDKNETGVIGHFGLGFYSAFMVADKVEIFTKSYKDEPAAHWTCDGSPEYTLEEHDKSDRGTEIVLHIAEDSTEFLEEGKIRGLLTKYNRFNQVPIKFGTKQINDPDHEPQMIKGEDGKEILTHTISADCGYDSNFLKKHKELKEQIKKELAELNIRLKKQEDLPQRTHIVIREIPKPVDLTKQYGDNKTIEWSWLEFFIGMLEGLRKET